MVPGSWDPYLCMSAPFPSPLGSHDIDDPDVDFLFTSVLDFQILRLQNELQSNPLLPLAMSESLRLGDRSR